MRFVFVNLKWGFLLFMLVAELGIYVDRFCGQAMLTDYP